MEHKHPEVVQVNSLGNLIASDAGTAIITVEVKDTGHKAQCQIVVTYKTVANYSIIIDIRSKESVVYSGTLKNILPHGEGTMIYPDGMIYVGDWKEGKRHGNGKLTFPNWDEYEGDFINDMLHGKGVLTTAAGIKYYFAFTNGKPAEKGIVVLPDRKTYDATFKNDKFSW